MLTGRLFQTFTFRIAILYLGLLCATVATSTAFIYWSTSRLIDRQMNETVQAEIRGLSEQYRDEGLSRLVEVIRERSGPHGDPQNVYLLTDPFYRPLAGNVSRWPQTEPGPNKWVEVHLHRTNDPTQAQHVILARVFELSGGYKLLVGRDTEERGDFRRIMTDTIAWAFFPTIALGLLGGVLIGRYTQRRVDAVRVAGQEIIEGDLSRRMPLSGSGDELDRLAGTINEMLERIDELMTGMRVVTDGLAHDLRSPLTRAKSSIDLSLRKDSDAATYRRALEQTNVELDTILRTFDALINIAHAETGLNRVAMDELDLSELVNDFFEMYQPIAEDAGVELSAEVADDITVTGHRQLLGQTVFNLLDNAIKFTPAGGRILLALDRGEDGAVLSVSDSGPGIPADERERVLKRFYRGESHRNSVGSGLGLSLVAAVAKLHGATLALDDAEPGLRVSLTFAGTAAADR